ncbi:hypothetical protein E2C01_028844 [Portunus trituberculatus]|uniref:Uncharacterized protein n=1 Tax=Portunus trituberculatus TaxID=210409 RepID=A0A5B7EML5_PORTR|nr:hypothetical protein [Portunus trituberculatus]
MKYNIKQIQYNNVTEDSQESAQQENAAQRAAQDGWHTLIISVRIRVVFMSPLLISVSPSS